MILDEETNQYKKGDEVFAIQRYMTDVDGKLNFVNTNKFISETELNNKLNSIMPNLTVKYLKEKGIEVHLATNGNIVFTKGGEQMKASELRQAINITESGLPYTTDGMTDEEINLYLQNDEVCKKARQQLNNGYKLLTELENKYNVTRGDMDNISNRANSRELVAYKNSYNIVQIIEDEIKQLKTTLKDWKDGECDQSETLFQDPQYENMTNIRRETLPDGTKVYHADQGYFKLAYNGMPGSKMSDEELNQHCLVKRDSEKNVNEQ